MFYRCAIEHPIFSEQIRQSLIDKHPKHCL
jgi:hypothetical protein